MSDRKLFPIPPAPNEWKELLSNKAHWKPGRSVCSVAHSWSEAQGVPPQIADLLGEDVSLVGMRPEYSVGFGDEGGIGGPVRCDVFARVKVDGLTCALVIEAKVDEQFGPEIGDWLRGEEGNKNSASNRECRLEEICEVLGVDFPPDDSLRYQLFSQTFAAVRMAECFEVDMAAMIVQSFCDKDSGHDHFLAFCGQFGVQPAVGDASDVALSNGLPLLLGWAHCPLPKR